MIDITTELRNREAEIRSEDDKAKTTLRDLREKVDAAHEDDVKAYGQALAYGQSPPKATASHIRDQIKRTETLVIPGLDEALWNLRDMTIGALRPDADPKWLLRLRSQLQRWSIPAAQDPFGILPGQRSEDPANARRPDDIVEWVEQRIETVERGDAERAAQEDRDERQRAMASRVRTAQGAWEREFYEREAEEEERNPSLAVLHATRNSSPLNPAEFRAKWLATHDPNDDYGYVTPGATVQAQGNPAAVSAMHARPAERQPEPTLTSTEA